MQDLPDQTQYMLEFYGLTQNPFGEEVDATVFSNAGDRSEVAEQLKHLLTFSPQDCLVMAPPQGGKRTLAQQVLNRLDDEWCAAWIDARETQQLDAVTRELIGQLGLGLKTNGDTASLYYTIADVIDQRTADGENFLLIVENADLLDSEVQQWVQSLRSLTGKIDNRLRQLWLTASATAIDQANNDDHWYSLVLEPFTGADALTYLRDRFAGAGQLDGVPIEIKDLNRLNDIAGGLPGELNQVAQDYLIAGMFRTGPKQQGFPLTHILAGAGVVTLIVVSVLYSSQPGTQTTASSQSEPVEAAESGESHASDVQRRLAEAAARVESRRKESDASDNSLSSQTREASHANSSSRDGADASQTELAKAKPADAAAQPVQPEPEQPAQPEPSSREAADPESAEQSQETDGSWLTSAPDSFYTLQLLGAREQKSVEHVVARLEQPSDYRIVESTYQDRPWYVLVHGQYEDADAARVAIETLPEVFSGQSPWPRTFASLRASLR